MAYLVLGLGIVMAVLGGLAISNGYPIIQVERGWASVIAGAALLAGGVVTFSLGIVVRSLAGVKAALLAGVTSAPYARSAMEPALDGAGQSIGLPIAVHPVPTAAAVGLGAVGASLAQAAPTYDEAPASHEASAHDEAPAYHGAAPALADARHFDHAGLGHVTADPLAANGADVPAEHPHGAHAAWDRTADDDGLQTPSTADHDTSAPAGAPPGDWLDRAFSELDLHVAEPAAAHETPHPLRTPIEALQPEAVPPAPTDEAAHAETAQHEPAQQVPAHAHDPLQEPVHAEPGAAHPAAPASLEHDAIAPLAHSALEPPPVEPAIHASAEDAEHAAYHHELQTAEVLEAERPPAAAPLAEPAPPPIEATVAPTQVEPSSPVIGRYEADGTSYTMYADGSIEAQSSAGIYRFASMAELKAFIEG